MSDTAIQLENVSLRIGTATILDNISAGIRDGEYVSIVGPNGAGKTTLLKCINRIEREFTGAITVRGRAQSDYAQRDLAKELSYVPQSDFSAVPYTARDFVLLGRYPHLSPFTALRTEDHEVANAMMETTGTLEFAERTLDTLSGGERQKVMIAAALAQGARVLLLDEPTAFLDYAHQVEVADLLARLHREDGITIVCVTHDAAAAARHSDRILGLRDGRNVFHGTRDEFLDPAVLRSIYDTDFDFVQHGEDTLLVPKGGAE